MNRKPLELQGSTTDSVALEHLVTPATREAFPSPATERSSEEFTLRGFAQVLGKGRWIIAASTIVAVIGGALYLGVVNPSYHAETLVQVEDKEKKVLGPQEPASPSDDSLAETEMKILRSRTLLSQVVKELRLDVVAEPRYFPLFGRGLARRYVGNEPAPPVLGMSSFAWGGERIAAQQFNVPVRWEKQAFTVVARGGGRYDLLDPNGALMGTGEIGKVLTVGKTSLLISKLTARKETRFRIRKIPLAVAIEALRKDLQISGKGKSIATIEIGLERPDPRLACAILDALARTYQRQNTERLHAEAASALEFITRQLPQVKLNAEKAGAALNAFRKSGSVGLDPGAATKAALERAASIERMLTELGLQRSELKQTYTANHPAMQALESRERRLREEREALDREMRRLPDSDFSAARLNREANVASEFYVLLLNKAQELSVVQSSTVGQVRVLDAALALPEPVGPHLGSTLGLSALIGLAIGIGLAFGRKAFVEGVDDVEVIERQTRLPVFASIPHSPAECILSGKNRPRGAVKPLAATHPDDLAIEALRSLRTSVQLLVEGAPSNVVAVMGPSPSVGKSFISVNLAHVLADAGSRVLLVDADLRKGTLHRHLGTSNAPGLSEVIEGTREV
ncbi:MAG TPA: GNVR domain-containing protein, partial [Anaeromyxobacteraceae bacterium]|nr:GNVR domain-containing protein [Anaeromyxobacteraceae bacterium]